MELNKNVWWHKTCARLARAARMERAGEREQNPRIFPTNEAWPNRRLTAENGGSEWQNGGGSVVESRAGSEHAGLRALSHAVPADTAASRGITLQTHAPRKKIRFT